MGLCLGVDAFLLDLHLPVLALVCSGPGEWRNVSKRGWLDSLARIRLDSSLPRGAFFAISSGNQEIISKLNAQSRLETENYYIDLISGSIPQLTPAAPAQLPELSDGPHMAYALQWVFFAGLAGYGRILIRRTR